MWVERALLWVLLEWLPSDYHRHKRRTEGLSGPVSLSKAPI